MDFNTITVEQEKVVVAKFKDFDRGVNMGKFTAIDGVNESKWGELVNERSFSNRAIQQKMMEIGRQINQSVDDVMLGDTTVAFTVTSMGKRIKFTWLDLYTFLRAVLRYRKESASYVEKLKEFKAAKAFIEANKSSEEKLKEAQAKLAALTGELGEVAEEDLA